MATLHSTDHDTLQNIAHDAMIQRGLLPDFSPAVIAETNQLTQAAAASGAAIRDLRGLLWASIDNDDSRDLDQLSVAEPEAGGAVKILVAIADVDALVKKGTAIDGHASVNTTSVYTAAEIFPMLPEKLSTDLTSLGRGSRAAGDRDRDGDRRRRHDGHFRYLPRSRSEPRQARLQRACRVARGHSARAAKACGGARTRRTAAHPGSGRAVAAAGATCAWRAATGNAGSPRGIRPTTR